MYELPSDEPAKPAPWTISLVGDIVWRNAVFATLLVTCLVPALVGLLGGDFSTHFGREAVQTASGDVALAHDIYDAFGGGFAHSVLVLLAGAVALMSSVLALAHYVVKRTPLAAVLSMALFWSASISLSNSIAVEGMLFWTEDVRDFLPMSGAIARFFTAAILVVGAAIAIRPRTEQQHQQRLQRAASPIAWPRLLLVFVLLAIVSIVLLVVTARLEVPQTVFPDLPLKRPWDLPALIIFAIGAIVIFPRTHIHDASHFSLAAWMSMIPFIASQIYLVFGSAGIFDHSFISAYLLNLLAFAVLFGGLAADYVRSAREEGRLFRSVLQSQARTRSIIENAADAIIGIDTDGRVRMWNPAASRIFGYTGEQAPDRRLPELISPADEREHFEELLARKIRAASATATPMGPADEFLAIRADGLRFWAEFTLVASESGNGGMLYTVFARDITERKQLKLRMIQMDRLITVGTIAAGVGHEINNPLSYVVTNAMLAREEVGVLREQLEAPEDLEPGPTTELLDEVDAMLASVELGTERIQKIVEDLRLLSSFQETAAHPVSLETAVRVALRMTRHRLIRRARVHEEYRPAAPIRADEARLTQVFINLLVNAVDALPERGTDENHITVRVFEHDGAAVAEVEDNGTGIEPSLTDRIFEMFYTTKPAGEGTGIGLALSRQIVEAFGGQIAADSRPGRGTTFRVTIPTLGDASA